MTGSSSETQSPATRPISVAELLARNGTLGATAVTRRHRRRRRDPDAVTVAELTGEIPIIRDDYQPAKVDQLPREIPAETPPADRDVAGYWSTPQARWPKSVAETYSEPKLQPSSYPWPSRDSDRVADQLEHDVRASKAEPGSGAEQMSPDPGAHYAHRSGVLTAADAAEGQSEVEGAGYAAADENAVGESAWSQDNQVLDASDELDEDPPTVALGADAADESGDQRPGKSRAVLHGGLVVLESILAVAFGAGLFIAFDQLWQWSNIVALVFSVLVILGLVLGVRVVRKTEDIGSTVIAVAVGALITLGPLVLLQSG
ncbi:MAG: hypothetical protein K2Q25_08695 [Mycobacteriaceae bacterium]|nr:hypothetical protein [Mycobacteriaceae bacterium]